MGTRGRPTLVSQGKQRRTDAQRSRDSYRRKRKLAQERESAAELYWKARTLLDGPLHREGLREILEEMLQQNAWAVPKTPK
jgi:hypothetical protein